MSSSGEAFDIIVVGGGHAGIEASFAAARMGAQVALVTLDANAVGGAGDQLLLEIGALQHLVDGSAPRFTRGPWKRIEIGQVG